MVARMGVLGLNPLSVLRSGDSVEFVACMALARLADEALEEQFERLAARIAKAIADLF